MSWDASGQTGDVRSVAGLDFGGRLRGASNGIIEMSSRLGITQSGTVDVSYPVRIELRIPEPNSFRDGEEVAIGSSWSLRPGWQLATTPAGGTLTLAGRFGFGASASADVCLFGCITSALFPTVNIPTASFDLLSITLDGGLRFPGLFFTIPVLPHTFTFIEEEFHGVSGTVDLPRITTATSLNPDGRSLRAYGSHTFVDVSVDLDSYLSKLGFPFPFGDGIPNIDDRVAAEYNVLDISMPVQFTESQEFTFTPDLLLEIVFPVAVGYRVSDDGGTQVASGSSDRVRFRVGHTLHVIFPSGRKTPVAGAPQYSLDNLFTSLNQMVFGAGFTQTVGTAELRVPSVVVTPAFTVDACKTATVDADPLGILPDEFCPVTTPAVRSPEIGIELGPLFEAHQPLPSTVAQLFPEQGPDCTPGTSGCGRWVLQGFSPAGFVPFLLDPEEPIVRASTVVASGLATGTGAAGTVTQTITVENLGDVRLLGVQVSDVLAGGTFGVRPLGSSTLSVTGAFDGATSPNTLTGTDVLNVGGLGTITASFAVQPGNIYDFAVAAAGTSPIGTAVGHNAAARLAVYHFDIRPTPVNAAANGVLPAVVLSNAALDARGIQPSSLRLDGVAPLRWDYEQRGLFTDLTLKFDRQAVMERIRARMMGVSAVAANVQVVAPDVTLVPVALPAVSAVAASVLGRGGALTVRERESADLLGNANGRLDLGDLRAIVFGHSGTDALAAAPAAPLRGSGGGNGSGAGGTTGQPRSSVALPLTGSMTNGTPLMAHDSVVVLKDGRVL